MNERSDEQEKVMKLHNEEKDIIKVFFKSDQEASNKNGHLSTTFGLQKVLNTPYGKNNNYVDLYTTYYSLILHFLLAFEKTPI